MDNTLSEPIKLRGSFHIVHRDPNGNILRDFEVPNVITNAGLAEVASLILSDNPGTATAFDYIAIGTGTTGEQATDTALELEISSGGGERAAATGTLTTTTVTNDTAQLQHTYNFSSSFAVTEAGVFNAASNGTMLCRKTFSAVNVANGDSLQITYKIQFS